LFATDIIYFRNVNVKEDTVVYRGLKPKFPPETGIGSF
jgi:hypothetical protein